MPSHCPAHVLRMADPARCSIPGVVVELVRPEEPVPGIGVVATFVRADALQDRPAHIGRRVRWLDRDVLLLGKLSEVCGLGFESTTLGLQIQQLSLGCFDVEGRGGLFPGRPRDNGSSFSRSQLRFLSCRESPRRHERDEQEHRYVPDQELGGRFRSSSLGGLSIEEWKSHRLRGTLYSPVTDELANYRTPTLAAIPVPGLAKVLTFEELVSHKDFSELKADRLLRPLIMELAD